LSKKRMKYSKQLRQTYSHWIGRRTPQEKAEYARKRRILRHQRLHRNGHPDRQKTSKNYLLWKLRDGSTTQETAIWAVQQLSGMQMMDGTYEYSTAMNRLTWLGRGDVAIQLWKEMHIKGIDIDDRSLNEALLAYASRQRYGKVEEVFDEYLLYNNFPNRNGCEQVLMAFEQSGKWERAMGLLEEMAVKDYYPDENSYLPAIRSCENAGNFEQADGLFERMRRETKELEAAWSDEFEQYSDREELLMERRKKKRPGESLPWQMPEEIPEEAHYQHLRWVPPGLPDPEDGRPSTRRLVPSGGAVRPEPPARQPPHAGAPPRPVEVVTEEVPDL